MDGLTMSDVVSATYTGPERRRRVRVSDSQLADLEVRVIESQQLRNMLDSRFHGIESRQQSSDDRMFRIEEALARNTTLTEDMAADTRETREIIEMGKALFRFASYFGRFVRWVGGIAAAAGAIWGLVWAYMHGGAPK